MKRNGACSLFLAENGYEPPEYLLWRHAQDEHVGHNIIDEHLMASGCL
jgi:hypothetical protein